MRDNHNKLYVYQNHVENMDSLYGPYFRANNALKLVNKYVNVEKLRSCFGFVNFLLNMSLLEQKRYLKLMENDSQFYSCPRLNFILFPTADKTTEAIGISCESSLFNKISHEKVFDYFGQKSKKM